MIAFKRYWLILSYYQFTVSHPASLRFAADFICLLRWRLSPRTAYGGCKMISDFSIALLCCTPIAYSYTPTSSLFSRGPPYRSSQRVSLCLLSTSFWGPDPSCEWLSPWTILPHQTSFSTFVYGTIYRGSQSAGESWHQGTCILRAVSLCQCFPLLLDHRLRGSHPSQL